MGITKTRVPYSPKSKTGDVQNPYLGGAGGGGSSISVASSGTGSTVAQEYTEYQTIVITADDPRAIFTEKPFTSIKVYYNGMRMFEGVDYLINSMYAITFQFDVYEGDKVVLDYK